jgi:predicted Rossmann fold flavoprotein
VIPSPFESAGGGRWPVVVVGAGAAGLTAATFAARCGAAVLLLETRPEPGAKIRISGGGRCNVLPSEAGPEDFWTGSSRPVLRNVLRSWPLGEVRDHFERTLGVALKTEPTGKVFPVSDSSREVVRALLRDSARAGVTLVGGVRVTGIARENGGFVLREAGGGVIPATRVILATGGRSLPKTGSDGAGWEFARSLGHTVRPTYPALVPLTTAEPEWSALAGVSLPVAITVTRGGRAAERWSGDFLFTHHGFSGPAVLHVSRHFTAPDAEGVAWSLAWGGEDVPWDELLATPGRRTVAAVLRERLPRRLADALSARAAVPGERPLSQLPRAERAALLRELTACAPGIRGSEGYRKAEVTAGGVPLDEIDGRTMESRRAPGLHLAGEVLDATGRLGGFNFLWAWVSGRRAGEGAANGD